LTNVDATNRGVIIAQPCAIITGRQLEHWHAGAMTRRASVLDRIEPEPVASVHPLDLEGLGVQPGETLTIESRRGAEGSLPL
jgi:formate dehydrogenase major subunit